MERVQARRRRWVEWAVWLVVAFSFVFIPNTYPWVLSWLAVYCSYMLWIARRALGDMFGAQRARSLMKYPALGLLFAIAMSVAYVYGGFALGLHS